MAELVALALHQQDVTHQHLQQQSLWLLVVVEAVRSGGGAGGVVVVSCHPLPTSNVPVTIGTGGATSTTVSACNGSDTVFGSTTPITAKRWWRCGGSNSGPHRGKDGGSGGGGGDDGSAVPGADCYNKSW